MTPPTYSSWLKVFEAFGKGGFLRRRVDLAKVGIGDPLRDLDVDGDLGWKDHADAEALHGLWGPAPESPWSPYHRPTLFAALDAARFAGPQRPPGPEPAAAPRDGPGWASAGHAVILDLAGPLSVLYGAWLARASGYCPVVTFNNWPHRKGLVDMEPVLAAMIYMGAWVTQAKASRAAAAPPVFLLDNRRFGARGPRPLDFDNRYYLLDSDLPGPQYFKNHGIDTVVYVRHAFAKDDEDDLNPYLHDLAKLMGLEIVRVSDVKWETTDPKPFAPTVRKTALTTTKDPAFRGFRRNAAGGFGAIVPEPNSGGG